MLYHQGRKIVLKKVMLISITQLNVTLTLTKLFEMVKKTFYKHDLHCHSKFIAIPALKLKLLLVLVN